MSFEVYPVTKKGSEELSAEKHMAHILYEILRLLNLDLSGKVIVTEAASGSYVITPIIAALAGAARVFALTRDSQYASMNEVIKQTRNMERICGLETKIEIIPASHFECLREADIVTNLGFVRPLNKPKIDLMKTGAVIPLMCEAWEIRPGDVDFKAANEKNIAIFGTNEEHPRLRVFDYVGWLCFKMMFDAGLDIHKNKVVIISTDKFGAAIKKRLDLNGIEAELFNNMKTEEAETAIKKCDVLVIADYTRLDPIIGLGGEKSVEQIVALNEHLSVIQFAGQVDGEALLKAGIRCYPGVNLPACRMAKTLADLGPRPVIELHSAGLKGAEIVLNKSKDSLWGTLVQIIDQSKLDCSFMK